MKDAIVNVVKIGGNIVDSPLALKAFLEDLAAMEGPKVLVHGGGKEATRLSAALGIETVMIDGRRVTDRETLDVVTMTYAGLINKRIVAMLQALGCNALGLSGADANVIPARRRNPQPVDYGYVGDIDPACINARFLSTQAQCLVPVLCAICHDGQGSLLNCNADSVAAAVATALAGSGCAVRLTYCFEKPGVMLDVDDDSSVIPLVTAASFEQLKADGIVAKGMIPKIHNALESVRKGVREVRICQASDLRREGGTIIRQE